ncbi:MAG: hypothetical protein CMK07_04850 [Ponticaulis sp.]|nr:hypothetical protein [Ponticaulis sp.]
MRADADELSNSLAELDWSATFEILDWSAGDDWARIEFEGQTGFIASDSIVEIAYVKRPVGSSDPKDLKIRLEMSRDRHADLIWGDLVQIIRHTETKAYVRSRGLFGYVELDELASEGLLECYIIDVGQGDGVLIRYPDGTHMMIDGGMARRQQATGKNAADFVDWKFYSDYGDWRINLDWMIASHSDSDHYGGLADLVKRDEAALEELDSLEVRIANFGHPGLSRFPEALDRDGLGPRAERGALPDVFTRLMGDRADASALVSGDGADGLRISGPWRYFIDDVLECDAETEFHRLSISSDDATAGRLPELGDFGGCVVRTLAPALEQHDGQPVLRDLGAKSINTNGHSVCLRLDYGKAKILMTGDLNTASMNWLKSAYGGDLSEWESDVAKACHHGSEDVSYSFLDAINAAATVISSGDNEGHAHPRPEIVAASALSGRKKLSDDGETVLTPLIYMTEIERSVELAEISRIEVFNHGETRDRLTFLGKPVDEYSDKEFFLDDDWDAFEDASSDDRTQMVRDVKARERERLRDVAAQEEANHTFCRVFGRQPTGVIGVDYPRKSLSRLRMMDRNIYGLVNVRTDGEVIMCASKRDNGERWTIHCFPAGSE